MQEAIRLVQRELDRLKVEADRLQREGDLVNAAEVLYGKIPSLEDSLRVLDASRIVMIAEGRHQALLTLADSRTWVAFPIDDLDPTREPTPPGQCGDPWHIGLDEAIDPVERRELVLERARAALRSGDSELASRLELDALAVVDSWIDGHRVFTPHGSGGSRVALTDADGIVWIAAPATDLA